MLITAGSTRRSFNAFSAAAKQAMAPTPTQRGSMSGTKGVPLFARQYSHATRRYADTLQQASVRAYSAAPRRCSRRRERYGELLRWLKGATRA